MHAFDRRTEFLSLDRVCIPCTGVKSNILQMFSTAARFVRELWELLDIVGSNTVIIAVLKALHVCLSFTLS